MPLPRSWWLLVAVVALIPPLAQAQTAGVLGDLTAPDIRAQISPRHATVLSSEIAGKILELPRREGERFARGDRLVVIDCALHRAALAKAKAAQEAARRGHAVKSQLGRLKATSTLEVDEAAATLAMAEAETDARAILVERCVVTAPFDGRVGEVKVKRYQGVKEGEPLLEIIDDRDLEVELVVPSRWLSWLRPGLAFAVDVEETGRRHPAAVTRLAASIDPVSQSLKVFARIVEPDPDLLPGMSGRAVIAPLASPPSSPAIP